MTRTSRIKSSVAALLFTVCLPALAQDYPSRPVRMIIPFAAGGPTDITGRLIGQSLTRQLNQTFIVVNKAGASSSIGTIEAARATPDGHTLLYTASTFALTPLLYKRVGYDPLADFQPITLTVTQPMLVVVNPKVPVATVPELIAHAKGLPGKVTYGTTGSGGITHLVVAEFGKRFGLDLVHVPYSGNGPVLIDLIGGQIQMTFSTFFTALPHVQGGRMRALAISSKARHPLLPNTPTITEAVGQEYAEFGTWHGMLVPRATPRSIVARLNQEMSKAMADPQLRQTFVSQGSEAVGSTPDQFSAYLKAEISRWGKVVQDIGLKPFD